MLDVIERLSFLIIRVYQIVKTYLFNENVKKLQFEEKNLISSAIKFPIIFPNFPQLTIVGFI